MDLSGYKLTKVPHSDAPVRMPDDDYIKLPPADKAPAHLPSWLSPYSSPQEQTTLTKFPRTRHHLELEELVFNNFFETFVDAIVTNGQPLRVIEADPRNIDPGRFMRWIKKDPERQSRLEEAQEIASELLVYQSDAIAEGTDSMEDIERSKLRLKQNEFKIKAWNKRRYGDTKQVDINVTTIDVRQLLEQRDQQLRTLEGEFLTVQNG